MDQLLVALTAAAPSLGQDKADAWAEVLEAPMISAGITTPRRIAAFIGQCAVESGGFTATSENLRYTRASRIISVWPTRFLTEASAAPYVNNPEALANNVYANRMGNGPPASGDGYRFRGLGLIQITGREEYTRFAKAVGRTPEDAAAWAVTPPGAAASATWFWTWKSLNDLADAWDLVTLTERINGGHNGLDDRLTACNSALEALGDDTP